MILVTSNSPHPVYPFALSKILFLFPDEMKDSFFLIFFEDLIRTINRSVICSYDKIDTMIKMIFDICSNNIGLITHKQRHDKSFIAWLGKTAPVSKRFFGNHLSEIVYIFFHLLWS